MPGGSLKSQVADLWTQKTFETPAGAGVEEAGGNDSVSKGLATQT